MVTNRSQFPDSANEGSVDILVVGSVNIDTTTYVDHFPNPGETCTSDENRVSLGGKGLNQALAAAMTGARVVLVCSANPNDIDSIKQATRHLSNLTLEIQPSSHSTGSAWICVSHTGENFVIVNPGANQMLTLDFLEGSIKKHAPPLVMLQGEISSKANSRVMTLCQELNIRVALNPSPMREGDSSLIESCAVLLLNKHEASELTGREILSPADATEVANNLATKNRTVVITMGSEGSVFAGPLFSGLVPAWKASSIKDTTGAGDRFAGILCGWLAKGQGLQSSLVRASEAAGKLCEILQANELRLS
ncbi:unannotated protein [freshwater metagenome]|uniref:Unannotated protein n=1 Tax=freshwater metagenome TaxID=449393 RepID=A0A6J6MUF7_9ZZZZ|nr:ribokinase [Rhodoluna sp.]